MTSSFQSSSLSIEYLAAGYFKYDDVKTSVFGIVNFIGLSGKTHQQSRNFIEELELVKWLSTSNMLNRVVDLLEHITKFLKKRKEVILSSTQFSAQNTAVNYCTL